MKSSLCFLNFNLKNISPAHRWFNHHETIACRIWCALISIEYLFFQCEGAQWACCNKLMYKHVLITTPTDQRHPLCWLPLLLSSLPLCLYLCLSLWFGCHLTFAHSRAVNIISHISSQLSDEKSLKAGNPKGCRRPNCSRSRREAFDLILQTLDERARAALKGIKMNWMKFEIENENENTCEKERKSRQYTKK